MNVNEVVDGSTALWIASKNGHSDVVGVLLNQSEIDINWNAENNKSALFVASSEGSAEVVKLLLARPVVDVNMGTYELVPVVGMPIWGCPSCPGTPTYSCSVRVHGIYPGSCLDDPKQTLIYNATALLVAAKNGHEEVVQLLLAHPNIDVNVLWQPLGHTEIQNYNDRRVSPEPEGSTPLSAASREGHDEVVEELIGHDKIDVNAGRTDAKGFSALYFASKNGSTRIIRLLLDYPSIEVNGGGRPNGLGKNPLYEAAENNRTRVVEVLLKDPRTDVNSGVYSSEEGDTALGIAAYRGYTEVVKLLLRCPKTKSTFPWRRDVVISRYGVSC